MENKETFDFQIKDYFIEKSNVLGSEIKLKKFDFEDDKKAFEVLDEYETKFILLDISGLKKAVDVINKISDSNKFKLILQEKGLLTIKYNYEVVKFETKLIGKGDFKARGTFNIEYFKPLLDSLNLKEVEKIEIYLKEEYPLALEIINKNGSKNKVILAPCLEDD